jgi:signal transduction histidine kinase
MIGLSEKLGYDKGIAMGNYWIGDSYIKKREFDKALVFFNISSKIFKQSGYFKFWTYSKATIANVYSMTDKYDDAIVIYKEVIKYHKDNNDIESMSMVMVNLARIYSERGNLTKALDLLYSAKLEFEKVGNYSWLASTERSLAVVYYQLREFDSAISINNRVKRYYLTENDNFRLGEIYSNIGELFEAKNENKKALDAYNNSLRYRKKVGDIGGIAVTQMSIGNLYLTMGLMDSVLILLETSRQTFKESKEIRRLVANMILTGNYYYKIKRFDEAIDYYLQGFDISKNNKIRESKKDAARLLSKTYEEIHEYQNALYYSRIYKIEYDSITNAENIKEQTIVEEGYKHKLQLLKKEKEIKYEKQQKYFAIVIGIIITLSLIFLIIYRRKLQKTKLLKLEHDNLLKIKEEGLKTQREERKRVANILHDNLAHIILNSQTLLNSILSKADGLPARPKLKLISENLEFMNKLAKVASYELEFSFVLEDNLVEQFDKYIARVQHSHSPRITFNHSNKAGFNNLDPEVKTNLFSVFQEMLGNAIKYAKAESIVVSIFNDSGRISLQVDDDGIGFDYKEARHGQGFPNMKERAEKLNGKFSFESEPGFGTKLKFEV